RVYKFVRWFDLPMMLKSEGDNMTDVGGGEEYGECIYDSGGNFITNSGVEKILMYRERPAYNQVTVQYRRDGTFNYFAECRSEHFEKFRSTSTFYMKYMNRALNNSEGSPILIGF